MTTDQFKLWYTDHCATFPPTAAYVNQFPKEQRDRLITAWRDILEPFPIDAAMEATRRLLDGRSEPLKSFDLHLTPRHVAGICKAIAWERNAHSPIENARKAKEECEAERKSGKAPQWSIARVTRILIRDRANGGSMTSEQAIEHAMDPDYVLPELITQDEPY